MKTQTSREYAEAILALAVESGKAEETGEALEWLKALLKDQPEFRAFLSSPAIARSVRVDMMRDLLSDALPDFLLSAMGLLINRNHIGEIEKIITEYQKLILDNRNASRAVVTSAFALDEKTQSRLKEKLEKKFNRTLELELRTDPSLIAGLKVEVEGRVLDGSLEGRLAQIKEVMST